MRALTTPVRPRSQDKDASASARRLQSEGTCRRTRPGMKWRTVNSMTEALCSTGSRSTLDDHGSGHRASAIMRGMHLDDMIEDEQAERDPNRGRRGSSDLEHRKTYDPDRERDLQVDGISGCDPDLLIEFPEEVDDRAGAFRMLRQKLRFLLDLVGKIVEVGGGRLIHAGDRLMHPAMEFVVPVHVVMHHHASGRRVARNALNAGASRERLADLPQQFGITLGRRDFHANPPRHLVRDIELHFRHDTSAGTIGGAGGLRRGRTAGPSSKTASLTMRVEFLPASRS